MKRKAYLKPTMQVVKLQQQYHILAGSGEQHEASGEKFTWDDEE